MQPVERPRLALTIHALHGGGAERLMSQLASRWSENNEVHLITWADRQTDTYQVPPEVTRHGLALQSPSRGLWGGLQANVRRVRTLRRLLHSLRPQLLLSFSDQMNIVALEAARGLAFPCWIAEHSDPARQTLGPLWEAWRRRSYPQASGCVALTPSIARFLERWIEPHRLRVIPPAISPPTTPKAAEPGGARKVVLFIGRLSREKGLDLLLKAWSEVEVHLPDWELHIAGDGRERPHLEALASATKRVHFLGWLQSPWPALATAGLFVLPSRYEGFPVALLEAMSQRRACIASRCSSAIDLLSSDGLALRVIDSESVEQLAGAIRQLAGDGTARRKMGERAASIADGYRWELVGPQWDQLLTEALAKQAFL